MKPVTRQSLLGVSGLVFFFLLGFGGSEVVKMFSKPDIPLLQTKLPDHIEAAWISIRHEPWEWSMELVYPITRMKHKSRDEFHFSCIDIDSICSWSGHAMDEKYFDMLETELMKSQGKSMLEATKNRIYVDDEEKVEE